MSVEVCFQHRYSGFELDVRFNAEGAGVTALFGPSGAGKTSIVNAIAGLLRPDAGRIAVNGRVLFDSKANVWIPPQARRAGYVFQDARLFPHLDVEGNLRFGWRRAASRLPETEVARILRLLGLEALLKRKPLNLSGGEKARAGLGRALLANPDFLLLDEPLAALDAERKNEIFPYLERLRDEARRPIIYVSHSLDEVSRLADTLVFVKRGRVEASGPVFQMLSDLALPDLSGGSPYGAVLETRIEKHLPQEGLSRLCFAGGFLTVPLLSKPEGTRLRTRLRAEDIILSREEPRSISANNVLPAVIAGIRESTPLHADIQLVCGPTRLVARITRASCERLQLCEGLEVFAIVKSVMVAAAGERA
jgi:molybdate transport system ATP-binding protein